MREMQKMAILILPILNG